MNKNTGGPAFPCEVKKRVPRSMVYGDLATGSEVVIETHQGMTLRDHFAGLAMQGLIVKNGGLSDPAASLLSTIAYRYADAMLAEREKGNE